MKMMKVRRTRNCMTGYKKTPVETEVVDANLWVLENPPEGAIYIKKKDPCGNRGRILSFYQRLIGACTPKKNANITSKD